MAPVPNEPRVDREGAWFVFCDGETRIALWVARGSHRERLYVNDELVADEPRRHRVSRHRVERDGVAYRLLLSYDDARRGELWCALSRDGEAYQTLALAPLARPVGVLTTVVVGAALGMALVERLPWAAAGALAVWAGSIYRARRAVRWAIGSPAEVRTAKRRARLHALRRLPAPLRGLRHTGRNLSAGLRLVTGRAVRPRDFRARFLQVAVLGAIALGLVAMIELLRVAPPRAFWWWGALRYAALCLALLAAVAAAVSRLRARRRALWLTVVLLSASAWYAAAFLAADRVAARLELHESERYAWAALALLALWSAHSLARALGTIRPRPSRGLAIPVATALALTFGAWLLVPPVPLWYSDAEYEDDPAGDDAELIRDAVVNTEGVYYRQPALLETALARLLPQRPGVPDVFFLGFASYASQDVFRKEVELVREVVERHFDAAGRSLTLVNHVETVDRLPLANPSNLGIALRVLGERLDVEEDVVFLYLTSHGSKDATLSVEFEPLAPNPLDAARLRELLDESGIRWRIVVISACYSGSFIDALRDAHTLVLTAAGAANTSFGCSDSRELTYFAEHLFDRELRRGGIGLLEAFTSARASLALRERGEGFSFSDPQTFVGERMEAKLRSLESRALRSARVAR